jgi:hypothetical protein
VLTRQTTLAIFAFAFAVGCGPTNAVPSPCAGNDAIYSSASGDASGTLHSATPKQVHLPPAEFQGRAVLRVLVDPRGRVVAESTHVETATRDDAALLKRWVASYQFRPATLGSCAVSSWYQLTITK